MSRLVSYRIVSYRLVSSRLVWPGLVWCGLIWSRLVWSGPVWSGLVSHLVWSGLVWPVRSSPSPLALQAAAPLQAVCCRRGDKFPAVTVGRCIVSALLAGLDEVIMPAADGAINRPATILTRFARRPPGGRASGAGPAKLRPPAPPHRTAAPAAGADSDAAVTETRHLIPADQ